MLSPGPLEQKLRLLSLPATVFPASGHRLRDRAQLIRWLNDGVANFGPDIVYAIGNKAALASLLPSKRQHIPLVWHKCDMWYDRRGSSLLATQCRRVFAPSHACGAAVPARRLRVIDPPVAMPFDFRVGAATASATIASIGRLEPRKGHLDVIKAAGILRFSVPDIRVVIAGGSVPYADGYKDQLMRAAVANRMGDRIQFVGRVNRIEDVLSHVTLVVSASYRDRRGRGGEGFGLAVAEASWAGLPVVVTRSGGTTEHVFDGINGLVVEPRNPRMIAAAVAELLGNPAKAAAMGERGAMMARRRFEPKRASDRLFAELGRCIMWPERPH